MRYLNEAQAAVGRNALRDYARLLRLIAPGDVVLDLGACVGTFSCAAAERGARVVAYEPDPRNLVLLTENVRGYAITVHPRAVTGDGRDVVLYRSARSRSNASTSVLPGRRDPTRRAEPSVAFADAVRRDPPNLIKVDVEGAEVEYDWAVLPPRTRAIAVELHADHCDRFYGDREPLAACVERLHRAGFSTPRRVDPRAWRSWRSRAFVYTRRSEER